MAADAEQPDASFLPLDAQRSHEVAPKPEAPGIQAERADSLRRTFGSLPADSSTTKYVVEIVNLHETAATTRAGACQLLRHGSSSVNTQTAFRGHNHCA